MEKGSNGDEKLQIIYRWKALSEENILEQFFSVSCTVNHSHSREKGFGHRIQSDDLASNWTNWRFREAQVGPTILLAPLLAQNYYSLYDFLNGMGAQDHGPNLTVNLNWRWKREKN
jgi:hypothetical protein